MKSYYCLLFIKSLTVLSVFMIERGLVKILVFALLENLYNLTKILSVKIEQPNAAQS